jgi:hypothetical protein
MIIAVLLLGLAGSGLLVWAARGLRNRPSQTCNMPSPDGRLCSGPPGHVGWHHRDGVQWYGNVWVPTEVPDPVCSVCGWPITPEVHTNGMCLSCQSNQPSSGQTLRLFFGIVAVLVLLIVGLGWAMRTPPPDPHEHCSMTSATVGPIKPYCPDSPDYHPTKDRP